MKIIYLTLQAFRGFNQKVTFQFSNANIIILYGPNGHGKTSVYDAIEWVLTGGIHRFNGSSDERNRTRFIRNLHADSSITTYVEIGIVTDEKKYFSIKRTCTAKGNDASDYGKHVLQIFDQNGDLYEDKEKAEKILNEWLIRKEWLPNIKSPTKMVGLTHVLAQEKISDFIKGMKDGERYNALSILFGTDYFEKYRNSYLKTRAELKSKFDELNGGIDEYEKIIKKLDSALKESQNQLNQNEDIDFNLAISEYERLYKCTANINDYKELLSEISDNLMKVDIEKVMYQADYQLIEKIENSLQSLESHRLTLKDSILLQEQLTKYSNLQKSKKEIEELLKTSEEAELQLEKKANLESSKIISITDVQEILQLEEAITNVVHTIEEELKAIPMDPNLSFLKDVTNILSIEHFSSLEKHCNNIINQQATITIMQQSKEIMNTHLKSIDYSIKQLQTASDDYLKFLNALQNYIDTIEDLNQCPACGREGIHQEHINLYLNREMAKLNIRLPDLEAQKTKLKAELDAMQSQQLRAEDNVIESIEAINEILKYYNNKKKDLRANIRKKQNDQVTIQYQIDDIQNKLITFQAKCETLGIKMDRSIAQQLKHKYDEYVAQLNDFNINTEDVNGQINMLEQQILKCNREIDRILVLEKAFQTTKFDLKDINAFDLQEKVRLTKKQIQQQLFKFSELEKSNLKLRSIIEFSTEKMRLIKEESQLEKERLNLQKMKDQKTLIQDNLEILTDLIDKSTVAVSNLNEKMFLELEETIQEIYKQINSHPLYTKLEFKKEHRHKNNRLSIHGVTENGEEHRKANATFIFSSAQVNSIALSLFLAMSLNQQWSPLQLIGMDDPIQSMDEINVLSFIDLIRLFVEKHQKQFIISTHDYSFYKMMVKKFRYHDLATIEYTAYGNKGPLIKTEKDNQQDFVKFIPKLDFENAKVLLNKLNDGES
ncbi:SMC family ATPase [Lysinibacillus sphaericus]|uniref:AAA family ATPase n=1 Tax=Lysinibacillus sphaericus TaxID=1421 RepID=UPI001E3634CE|nr:SMC family ATPase [Lysinibacillus sphaericus]UDK97559.1 SMC family ATPase [Lysinibacillus sphaericus]